jgi:hypothetical protein
MDDTFAISLCPKMHNKIVPDVSRACYYCGRDKRHYRTHGSRATERRHEYCACEFHLEIVCVCANVYSACVVFDVDDALKWFKEDLLRLLDDTNAKGGRAKGYPINDACYLEG